MNVNINIFVMEYEIFKAIVQVVSAKKGLIVHFVNSHGAFAQVFKMLTERHVPRPQMISSILILPIGGHIG